VLALIDLLANLASNRLVGVAEQIARSAVQGNASAIGNFVAHPIPSQFLQENILGGLNSKVALRVRTKLITKRVDEPVDVRFGQPDDEIHVQG